ncbi:BQ5605_C010g05895 [Microbotryum silenes-dioicae]|uniref:BQ5605_C010g05895 protein n=1 Tax=Microbotryum silenes-dioicae TaxID=796604 RepID=A0A2X0NSU6_9BASI|nr:BQ5605_C010g05895 [Microbotryum silenes-dioicae]
MSAPVKLSFGLNKGGATKKLSLTSKPLPKKKNAFGTAIGQDDSDDSDEATAPIASTSKATAGRPMVAQPPANTKLSRAQKQKQEEQLALDATVFEYDEVFDQMKEASKVALLDKKKESAERKPKYISRLLETAELRKQDRLRAEDKMVQREREREGEEFADKDAFVTPAYLAQQEELRKVEEEEKKREELEAGKSGGMTSFYKSYLDTSSKEHEAAVAATLAKPAEGTSRTSFNVAPPPKEKTEAELAAEVSAQTGRRIEVNDDGEIIDKRQLLGGGLNLVRKPKSDAEAGFSMPISQRKASDKDDSRYSSSSTASLVGQGLSPAERARQARERQSRELERQMLEVERKRKIEDEEAYKSKVQKVQKRNDKSKVEMLKRQAEERRLKRAENAKKTAAATAEGATS